MDSAASWPGAPRPWHLVGSWCCSGNMAGPPVSVRKSDAHRAMPSRSPRRSSEPACAPRQAAHRAAPRRGPSLHGRHRRGHQPPSGSLVAATIPQPESLDVEHPYRTSCSLPPAAAAAIPSTARPARPDPPTRSGRWLSLAACPLGSGRVAVCSCNRPPSDQLLPAIRRWYEFTPAQLDVIHLLDRPVPSKDTTVACDYPTTTVEDHLNSLYRKQEPTAARILAASP